MDKNSPELLDTPNARAERLRWLRRLSNKTVRDISETYGISADTLKGWELSKFGGLTKKGAQRVLEIYRKEGIECGIDWIYSGIGEQPRLISTHFSKVKNINSSEIEKINIEIDLLRENYRNIIKYQINDNSMTPYFFQDDVVAGDQYCISDLRDISRFINKILIVQTLDGKIYLRRLQYSSQSGLYNLYTTNCEGTINTADAANVALYSVAPVLRIYRVSSLATPPDGK